MTVPVKKGLDFAIASFKKGLKDGDITLPAGMSPEDWVKRCIIKDDMRLEYALAKFAEIQSEETVVVEEIKLENVEDIGPTMPIDKPEPKYLAKRKL